MMQEVFDAEDWVERLATSLPILEKAQQPYLERYWRDYPRTHRIVDGRDVTPFPLDDVRTVYAMVRHSRHFGKEAQYAPLQKVLDPVHHALLAHPTLQRVAVTGRTIGENDFWMQIVNSGSSISAGDLIAGLMARAAELSGDRFRTASRELGAFLLPAGDKEAASVLGNLDEGCDIMLFYGLVLAERIDVRGDMAILPYRDVLRFVDAKYVRDLAPDGAVFHGWRPVGAMVRRSGGGPSSAAVGVTASTSWRPYRNRFSRTQGLSWTCLR